MTLREIPRKIFDGSHPYLGCFALLILGLILAYVGIVCYAVIANWGGCGPGTGRACLSPFS
jgi:hypothetical protein